MSICSSFYFIHLKSLCGIYVCVVYMFVVYMFLLSICRSSSLSSDVTHWHQYQNMVQHLMPWLDSAERHLEDAPEKMATETEAQSMYEQHQVGRCLDLWDVLYQK